MLTHIHIRDFAVIEGLELTLAPGMCVLTGETGAGKSILIDALGLVLGDRADSASVRDGAERAEITVQVHIADDSAGGRWLAERELDDDGQCILRRVVGRDGRSRAFVNGSAVTLAELRGLGELLVDIHGQHAHQSLLRRAVQRELLDTKAGNEGRLRELASLHRALGHARGRLQSLSTADDERAGRLALLRYQIAELEALAPHTDELAELEREQRRLSHAAHLKAGGEAAYGSLYEADDGSVYEHLAQLTGELEALREHDATLAEPIELLHGAQAQIQEAAHDLRRYAERVEIDPQRLESVEARLGELFAMARKHRVAPETLGAHLETLQAERERLEGPEHDVGHWRSEVARLEGAYRSLAEAVRGARIDLAAKLGDEITAAMRTLGMTGGVFEIAVEPDEDASPSAHGLDRIEFRVSTHPGQPVRPLAKVASGGELSRISLAIQMVAAHSLAIPTLIFDEVDAGTGGAVAEVLGRRLRSLGADRQVLCVTHLPQVAAQAHRHYQVNKHPRHARTQIQSLDPDARIEETARMLGGVELTEQTRAHAEEMIKRAQAS